MSVHRCDFCGDPVLPGDTGAMVYDAQDFASNAPLNFGSRGAWLACATCDAFIRQYDLGEEDARTNLARRAKAKYRIRYKIKDMPTSEVNQLLLNEINRLHAAFWVFRKTTPPVPYSVKQLEER